MALPNVFSKEVADRLVSRINALTAASPRQWGKMSVDQMLAHCNVTYELVYEDNHPKPGLVMGFILKKFVKNKVVTEVPYTKSGQTAPAFIVKTSRDFDLEKKRLIQYILQTKDLGEKHFDNKMSHSFGTLSSNEWNNMFYKHLDHHLTQFGV